MKTKISDFSYKFLRALMLASVPMVLSSCICFEYPLSEKLMSDKRLAGVWHGRVQGNDEYLHIFDLPDGISLKLFRVIHINAGGVENHDLLEMYPSLVNGRRYLNLKIACPDSGNNLSQSGWIFVRYEVTSNDELHVYMIDYEVLKAALNKKSLHGSAWETSWEANARISDKSERLREFINSEEGQFKTYGVFRRVVDVQSESSQSDKGR